MSISLSGSLVITGSIVASGGITGSFSGSATTSSYALTASSVNPLTQSLSVSGSITATGILTAQTLVVQTITSSIVYSSGSNIFGNQLTDVQQMTGSLRVTGSLSLNNIAIPTSASLASTYLPLAGGTLTGALSATSATFNGAVTIGNDNAYALTIGRYSAAIPISYIKASTSSTGGFRLTNHNGADVIIVSGSNYITLDAPTTTTGAATFSSSLTFANGVTNNIGSDKFFLGSGGYNYLYCRSTGLQILNQADTTALVTILNGGNVGINATTITNPNGLDKVLEIKSAGSVGVVLNDSRDANPICLENRGAVFHLAYGTSNLIVVDGTNKNVGIGRANYSQTRLTVQGSDSTSSNYAFRLENSGTSGLFEIRNDGLINLGTAAYSPYNYDTTGRTPILQSNGLFGYLSSTRESKTNIEQLSDISWLYQLNPVSFNYRKKDDEMNYTDEAQDDKWYGLIADEVEGVNQNLVFYNTKEDGSKQLAGVEYNKMIPVLVKAIQEQQATITSLQEQINELKNK